jgi:hypothetical protein
MLIIAVATSMIYAAAKRHADGHSRPGLTVDSGTISLQVDYASKARHRASDVAVVSPLRHVNNNGHVAAAPTLVTFACEKTALAEAKGLTSCGLGDLRTSL